MDKFIETEHTDCNGTIENTCKLYLNYRLQDTYKLTQITNRHVLRNSDRPNCSLITLQRCFLSHQRKR